MWRYLSGAQPPVKKTKVTADEVQQRHRSYDSQERKRSFQNVWLKTYPWPSYDDGNNKMFCRPCKTYGQDTSGTFVTGCSNFRIESLRAHDQSKSHERSMSIERAEHQSLTSSKSSIAEQTVISLNESIFNRLLILFKNAHYLAKSGRPFTDFIDLCKLDESKGLSVGTTYRSDKQAATFVHYIAQEIRSNHRDMYEKCKFCSVITDGSTDSSITESEIVFLRTCMNGEIHTYFVGVKNVQKADAKSITETLADLLDETTSSSWRTKIVGTGTDGASVMMGRQSGVVARLKDLTKRPFIQGVHCSAHRLELVFKDACKCVHLFQRVEQLLVGLYIFYKTPLNRSNLKVSFDALDNSCLIPTRSCGTRWLAHTRRALHNILTGYCSLVHHLQQLQNPDDPVSRKESALKAKNFLSTLTERKMLYFLMFLWDVVICLAQVSEIFQKQTSTLGDVYTELQAAKRILTQYKTCDTPKLKEILDQPTYQTHPLSGNADGFQSAKIMMLEHLIKSIDKRFEGDIQVMKNTSVGNLALWPVSLEDDGEFGDQKIQELLDAFDQALESAGVDCSAILPEWQRLKSLVYSSFPDLHVDWRRINRAFQDTCPNILHLMDLIRSLPSTSAEAERGFSVMKLVKNDWRNSLSDKRLSDLMIIQIESPDVGSFDPKNAIILWNREGNRRPDFLEVD